MQTKHTKAPWILAGYAGQHDEAGAAIKDDKGNFITTTSSVRNNNWQEYFANAKLITAAPELLEALQDMVKMYEKVQPAGGYQGYYETAIYAIKKATK